MFRYSKNFRLPATLIIFFIIIGQNVVGQKVASTKHNAEKEYDYLLNESKSKDSAYAKKVATNWLAKAKAENNTTQMAMAYRAVMYHSEKKYLFTYTDSLIITAKKSRDKILIGKAYLTKGILFYNDKEMVKALNNYVIADQYIAQTHDKNSIYKIKYAIAHIKYYLGFYEEAISLFKECLEYYEEENETAYLNTIHSLGLCYNKTGQFAECSHYNLLGIQSGIAFQNYEMEPYFRHSEAINNYFKKQFKKSAQELLEVLPEITAKKDFANETVGWFYLGKNYIHLQQEEKAIEYFLKVDNAFVKYGYTRPDLRENSELLIKYYDHKNNTSLKLVYINRLLKVDSVLNQNYRYLSKKIFKEYDTKKLVEEKKKIAEESLFMNRIHYCLITILALGVTIMYFRQYKIKKGYRQKFEKLMSDKNLIHSSHQHNQNEIKQRIRLSNCKNKTNDLDISPELELTLLQNLEKFEKNKKFLEKDMVLNKIAINLKTNSKYALKIIQKYRRKKTIEYITDLKIDYILHLLQTENKFRKYTNTALAQEAGFGSTQNFTKAFNNRTGMPPTYFIEELKKSFPL